jgi:hypothetical protein
MAMTAAASRIPWEARRREQRLNAAARMGDPPQPRVKPQVLPDREVVVEHAVLEDRALAPGGYMRRLAALRLSKKLADRAPGPPIDK